MPKKSRQAQNEFTQSVWAEPTRPPVDLRVRLPDLQRAYDAADVHVRATKRDARFVEDAFRGFHFNFWRSDRPARTHLLRHLKSLQSALHKVLKSTFEGVPEDEFWMARPGALASWLALSSGISSEDFRELALRAFKRRQIFIGEGIRKAAYSVEYFSAVVDAATAKFAASPKKDPWLGRPRLITELSGLIDAKTGRSPRTSSNPWQGTQRYEYVGFVQSLIAGAHAQTISAMDNVSRGFPSDFYKRQEASLRRFAAELRQLGQAATINNLIGSINRSTDIGDKSRARRRAIQRKYALKTRMKKT